MLCLIDADTIAFACAATAEDSDLWVATSRANDMVESILNATHADEYELWLSGKGNFRYNIYPEYKANRTGSYRPKWEKLVKDYLTEEWKANWSDGCEADDMVGVRQCELKNTIIAHMDKDINMIPGMHYGWPLTRLGKLIKAEKTYEVTDEEALYNFYYQLIVGDTTDNIPGVRGAGPVKAIKLLQEYTSEEDRFNVIRDLYSSDEEMNMMARCLWIWRKMDDNVLERWKEYE
jgi:5'-3' exonuclease